MDVCLVKWYLAREAAATATATVAETEVDADAEIEVGTETWLAGNQQWHALSYEKWATCGKKMTIARARERETERERERGSTYSIDVLCRSFAKLPSSPS